MEFFVILIICHLASTFTLYGILTETIPKERKELRENLVFFAFVLLVPLFIFNSYRINSKITKEGVLTSGIVKRKQVGTKSVRWLESTFNHNGVDYKSTFHLDREIYDTVKIKDNVLVKYIEDYPKLNRTEKLLKE